MKTTIPALHRTRTAPETKPAVQILRETEATTLDDPEKTAEFLRKHAPESPRWTPGREQMIVLHLNTRRRVIDWQISTTGTLDTLLCHPREIFRGAITVNAHAILIAHNHPSGDTGPSEADIRVTRDLIRAGQLLKIEVLDHIVFSAPEDDFGNLPRFTSLKELGYFYN
jgi:DNA repair protein RadC